jgi:uncharacterized FlgJ-related protein
LLALRDHISKYKDLKEADSHTQELKIHMRHFEDAIKKVRPLSTQELNIYKGIADQFGKSELINYNTSAVNYKNTIPGNCIHKDYATILVLTVLLYAI